ncbi:TIGR02206 family membrane protein [Ruminococcaceae bacterium OttesenSCG-928-D13]|nr:TIGR02206 family membrane protein [Ruminococcaceae bacterium OttesenSCG-928-D13]
MEWFFVFYHNQFPQGTGFAMYGPEHLCFLLGIAITIVFVCVVYRRATPEKQALLCRVVAGTCFALEAAKQVVLLITLPSYPVSQLTLHLCGLGIFVQMVDAFVPRWRKTTREILYSLSLPGAAAALFFPDWTAYPLLNFYCLQSFIIHGVLLCYPIILLASHQMRPNWRRLWRPALFIVLIAGPIFLLNRRLGTNFLFINGGSAGSPLEVLENLMGNPGYLVGYVGLVLVVWLLMYLPFIITDAFKTKQGKPIGE